MACRRFRTQHDGIGAFIDRGGHVRNLGPGRHRALDHRFEHLRRHDHRLRRIPAFPHQPLLDRRHRFHRHFNPQIASRHHDPIGHRQDILETFYRGGFFYLRQDRGVLFLVRKMRHQDPRFRNIFGALHKRQGQPIYPQPAGKFQIPPVLGRERGQRQDHIRHVHAFAVRYRAPRGHLAIREIRSARFDLQPNLPVIDQNPRTGLKRLENFGMRQAYAGCIPLGLIQIQPKIRALNQVLGTVLEHAHTQLRPLQIRQNAHRTAQIDLNLANRLIAFFDLVMTAMAHIQPQHIRARLIKRPDHFIAARSRAQRGHDFDVSITAHGVPRTYLLRFC